MIRHSFNVLWDIQEWKVFCIFDTVSKCEDIYFTTIIYKLYNISKMWLCAQFFLIIKNFKIKLFWRLVSPDCNDTLSVICQTLAFLLDISLKHCLFFVDNIWRFEYEGSENLTEGCSPDFLGLPTKALLSAFPWENDQHILQSHPYYLRFHEKMINIFYKATHSQ